MAGSLRLAHCDRPKWPRSASRDWSGSSWRKTALIDEDLAGLDHEWVVDRQDMDCRPADGGLYRIAMGANRWPRPRARDGGRRKSRLGGTANRFATRRPALSTRTTSGLPPSGSVQRVNSPRAAAIRSALAAGRCNSRLLPLAGWTKPRGRKATRTWRDRRPPAAVPGPPTLDGRSASAPAAPRPRPVPRPPYL